VVKEGQEKQPSRLTYTITSQIILAKTFNWLIVMWKNLTMPFFFSEIKKEKQKAINQVIPQIDIKKCSFCKSCVEYCEFNAIVIIPIADFAEVNKNLCHSCGACSVACKTGAIKEVEEPIGNVNFYNTHQGKGLIEGNLRIGSAMQTMLIKELKKEVDPENEITLLDAPPGTSCPVVETTSDADFVVLVTEPTPFGLHDLKLMVELMNDLKKDIRGGYQ
jgi:MinD superfamily P-loop ATPase